MKMLVHFITAPLISQIVSNFRKTTTEKKHHQNIKSYSKRQNEMKEKLTSVLRRCNVNFKGEMEPEMHNFVTKQVFSEEVKKDVLSVESIRKVEYDLFVKERMSGESKVSIWAPSKKLKTKVCSTANKGKKTKMEDKGKGIKYLVSANHETYGNLPCIGIMNNHEEADTLMIWHCVHFSSTTMKEKSTSITVFSPDTDVACLLIAFKKRMSTDVYLHTGKHIISVDSVYQSFGQVKADALLSLHAISGCDTTGRFLGKGKTSWWNP